MSHASGFPILLQHAYTEAEWAADNPVLMDRETGWTTDTRRVKLGDGETAWNDLPYAADEAADVAAETARAEAAEQALEESIDVKVAAAVAAHTPGIELGYAERTTNFSTTATAPGATALIPSLVTTVIGQGRPVDIEFYAQTVRHSVAGKYVVAYFEINGSFVNTVAGQSGLISSPDTVVGRTIYMKRRAMLADGQGYTIKVGVYGEEAGTTSLVAVASAPTFLEVTSR